MNIWVGDDLMLGFPAVVCFCLYFYIYEFNRLLNIYKDAAGLWHEDRFRPLVTSVVNLVCNLIIVQFCGIYGVLLSTVISMVAVGMPWLLYNMFTVVFEKNLARAFIFQMFKYLFIALCVSVITYIICVSFRLKGWVDLIARIFICIFVPNLCFVLVYHRKAEFKQSIQLIDKITKGRFHITKIVFR